MFSRRNSFHIKMTHINKNMSPSLGSSKRENLAKMAEMEKKLNKTQASLALIDRELKEGNATKQVDNLDYKFYDTVSIQTQKRFVRSKNCPRAPSMRVYFLNPECDLVFQTVIIIQIWSCSCCLDLKNDKIDSTL